MLNLKKLNLNGQQGRGYKKPRTENWPFVSTKAIQAIQSKD
jgi:hypothetical protein